MNFQSIVLIIAGIALVTSLIIIGISLKDSKKNVVYPPVIGECPDYWEDQSSEEDIKNGKNKCVNIHHLGKPSCSKNMDFSVYPYSGADGVCNKKSWAKTCGLTWDGITNNKSICKHM
jgi:hypothetical protein